MLRQRNREEREAAQREAQKQRAKEQCRKMEREDGRVIEAGREISMHKHPSQVREQLSRESHREAL